MTQVKAQTVISALIAAGYSVSARVQPDGEWVVEATGNDIDVQTVAAFATSKAVIGTINYAKFV